MSKLRRLLTPRFPMVQPRAEHVAHRALMALVVYAVFAAPLPFHDQPHPNGIARWFDVTFFTAEGFAMVSPWLLLAMCVLHASGRAVIVSTAYLMLHTLLWGTLMNSQGAIGHATQLVTLVLLVQLLTHVWCTLRRLRGPAAALPTDQPTADDMAYANTLAAIAAAYVIAGVTKLHVSGLDWFADLPNIAVQVIKTNDQQYFNHLNMADLERGNEQAAMILEHPSLTRVVFGFGLVLEVLAFLMLLGRRWALAVGVALIAMHLSIGRVMNLHFTQNVQVLLIYVVNVPWLALSLWPRVNQHFAREQQASAADAEPG